MEKNLSLRILDSIRELKTEVEESSQELQLEQSMLQVDPLLKYMGKKYGERVVTEIAPVQGMVDAVTMRDITSRIQEIVDGCLMENRENSRIYVNEQEAAVLALERELREIQNTRGFYQEIRNVGRFQNYCSQVETKYNAKIAQSLNACANSFCQSCDSTITKIRAILTKIKDERVHVSWREFWVAYDTKADMIKRRIQSTAGRSLSVNALSAFWLPGLRYFC